MAVAIGGAPADRKARPAERASPCPVGRAAPALRPLGRKVCPLSPSPGRPPPDVIDPVADSPARVTVRFQSISRPCRFSWRLIAPRAQEDEEDHKGDVF
jgi:hypothetical protein